MLSYLFEQNNNYLKYFNLIFDAKLFKPLGQYIIQEKK